MQPSYKNIRNFCKFVSLHNKRIKNSKTPRSFLKNLAADAAEIAIVNKVSNYVASQPTRAALEKSIIILINNSNAIDEQKNIDTKIAKTMISLEEVVDYKLCLLKSSDSTYVVQCIFISTKLITC